MRNFGLFQYTMKAICVVSYLFIEPIAINIVDITHQIWNQHSFMIVTEMFKKGSNVKLVENTSYPSVPQVVCPSKLLIRMKLYSFAPAPNSALYCHFTLLNYHLSIHGIAARILESVRPLVYIPTRKDKRLRDIEENSVDV